MYGIATKRISDPLSHQSLRRFIHCRIHPQKTAEYALRANQYIAFHFSMIFSHTWYLMRNLFS